MADSNKKGKGFAGLDSMVSDVEVDLKALEQADVSSRPDQKPTSEDRSPPVSATEVPPRPPLNRQSPTEPAYSPQPNSSGQSKKVWAWVLGFVVLAIFIGPRLLSTAPSNRQPTTSPSPSPSSPPASSNPPSLPLPSYERESTAEQIPPIGSGNLLSSNEIRYCVSEDIRLEIMKGLINSYSQYEIDQFNAAVNHYNSRCSNFRYKQGTLESIQAKVELSRGLLFVEAQNKVSAWRRNAENLHTPPAQPNYVAPTYTQPAYSPPSYVPPPNFVIDDAAVNRAMEQGRQAYERIEAAQRVCGALPVDISLEAMQAHTECMRSQGAYQIGSR